MRFFSGVSLAADWRLLELSKGSRGAFRTFGDIVRGGGIGRKISALLQLCWGCREAWRITRRSWLRLKAFELNQRVPRACRKSRDFWRRFRAFEFVLRLYQDSRNFRRQLAATAGFWTYTKGARGLSKISLGTFKKNFQKIFHKIFQNIFSTDFPNLILLVCWGCRKLRRVFAAAIQGFWKEIFLKKKFFWQNFFFKTFFFPNLVQLVCWGCQKLRRVFPAPIQGFWKKKFFGKKIFFE